MMEKASHPKTRHKMNLHGRNENQIPNNLKAGQSSTNLKADLDGPFIFPKIPCQEFSCLYDVKIFFFSIFRHIPAVLCQIP